MIYWVILELLSRVIYLLHRHTSRQQLDQITGLEDRSRIERLSGRLDCHATLDQIQRTGNTEFLERSCHNGPCFLQVDFTVLGEQSGEGRFFSETTGDIVIGLEGFDLVATNLQLVSDRLETFDFGVLCGRAYLPLVNVIRVPRLVPLVGGRHDESRGGSCDLRR